MDQQTGKCSPPRGGMADLIDTKPSRLSERPSANWRPWISLRTFFIGVTLICVYCWLWKSTTDFGIPAVYRKVIYRLDKDNKVVGIGRTIREIRSPFPFVIISNEYDDGWDDGWPAENDFVHPVPNARLPPIPKRPDTEPRRYYIWLGNAILRLPFESTW